MSKNQPPPRSGNDAPSACGELFEGGPPRRFQKWLRLHPHTARKTALVAALCWLPLAILSAVQSFFWQQGSLRSFGTDFAVHVRCLITVPLFILAEAVIVPRLGLIAQHFLDAGLVAGRDRPRFDSAVASTRRLHESLTLEMGVIALTVFLLVGLTLSVPSAQIPLWQRAAAGVLPRYSPAGWWHVLVSLPVLLVLFVGWMWRLFLWTRFLGLMSRLDLQLVAAHPDRAAGLKFVASSVPACSILAFALGAVVAGRVANGAVHEGISPLEHKYLIAGAVVFVVVLFSGPPLVFTRKLIQRRRRGVLEYGALASGLGQRFERKWLPRLGGIGDDSLEAPDFSAATDLYAVAANVYEMRLTPLGLRSVLPLVMATLLPLVPVLLMAVPLGTLLKRLLELFF